jgi:hypothetical protein
MKAEKKNLKTPAAPVATSVIELSEEAFQKVTGGNTALTNLLMMEHEVLKNVTQNLRA